MVEEAKREGRPRHARPGHRKQRRDHARDAGELAGDATPRMQRGDAVAQLRARRVELADERDPELTCESNRAFYRCAAAHSDCAVVFASGNTEGDDAPALDLGDLGGSGFVGPRM
jgi:ribosomal protein L19E